MFKPTLRQLLIILFLSLTMGVFAKTNTPNIIKDNGINLAKVKVIKEFGNIRFDVTRFSNFENNPMILLKIEDNYFGPSGNLLNSEDCESLIASINTSTSDNGKLDSHDKSISWARGLIELDVLDTSSIVEDLISNNSFITNPIVSESDIKVWLINSDGNTLYLNTTLDLPFFEGESDIFNELFTGIYNELSYNEKAIFYISTFFLKKLTEDTLHSVEDTDERTEFLNVIKNSSSYELDNLPPISVFDIPTDSVKSDIYEKLELSHAKFKNSFYSHFNIKMVEGKDLEGDLGIDSFPTLNITKATFDSIYQNDNIYVSSYLKYLLSIGKPALSFQINEILKEIGTAEPDIHIKYNFSQYETLTPADGIKLADSALRYLTWGVEYTPYKSNNSLDYNSSITSVYASNKSDITSWINYVDLGGDSNERYKKNNYYTGVINKIEAPLIQETTTNIKNHVLTGNFTGSNFRFISKSKIDSEKPKISKVDFWTSENIAWRPDTVSGVYIGENSSVAVSNNLLFNKELHTGEDASKNIIATRLATDMVFDNITTTDVIEGSCPPLTFGYDFRQNQTVSAVLLVTGKEYKSEVVNSYSNYNYKNNPGFNLKIYVNDNDEVTNVREYMVSNQWGEIYKFDGSGVGSALALSHGTTITAPIKDQPRIDNNEELVYIYYVFDQEVDVSNIKIIDKTGTTKVSLTELMVFESNPITHFTSIVDNYENNNNNSKMKSLSFFGFDNNSILYNGDPNKSTSSMDFIADSINIVSLDINPNSNNFNNNKDFKQIVIWEPNSLDYQFKTDFSVLTDSTISLTESLFAEQSEAKEKIVTLYDNHKITSPFSTQGNAIPYASKGIDSPKTFNYKMVKQNEAREKFLENHPIIGVTDTVKVLNTELRERFPEATDNIINTLLAVDSNNNSQYMDNYITEIDLYRDNGTNLSVSPGRTYNYSSNFPENVPESMINLKPFLPGLITDSINGLSDDYKSLFSPNKVAGVDSIGMLLGAISMSAIKGEFLNVFNNNLSEGIDDIYRNNNFDFHYRDNDDSILNKPIRFTKVDLERNSVIVPSLNNIRPGDILVKYNDDGESHIGIIISSDITGDEVLVEDKMKKVLVLSTKRSFRMANLGVWMGSNNIYGGFAAVGDEKSYHVRRLLKYPQGTDKLDYEEVHWELLDKTLVELSVDMELNSPWISNVGEPLNIVGIDIQGIYSSGELENLVDLNIDIKILPPVDPYKDEVPEGFSTNSNVYANTGSGLEFFAKGVWEDDRYLLAKFELLSSGEYQVNYTNLTSDLPNSTLTDAFDENGIPNDRFEFKVDGKKLTFITPVGVRYTEFSVRPYGDIDPGDDFLLNFGLQNNSTIKGNAKTQDQIAVYDHKMLWRANLYIEEAYDWNDVHPWNDNGRPWIATNDWNAIYNGTSRLSDENDPDENDYLPGLTQGTGGQVVTFNSFTYSPVLTEWFGDGAVAYSYGSADSPFEFNDEMRQQQILLSGYYNSVGDKFKVPRANWGDDLQNITDITDPDFTLKHYDTLITDYTEEQNEVKSFREFTSALKGWGKTTTPTGFWTTNDDKYIKPSTLFGLNDTQDYEEVPAGISSLTGNFPFLPGWGLNYFFSNGRRSGIPNWIIAISAGADCNGFVSRAASYTNNPYSWADSRNHNIHNKDDWYTSPSYPLVNDKSYLITDKNNKNDTDEFIGLNKIKPGDIMYYTGTSSHIAIVSSIDVTDVALTVENIHLIESSWYGTASAKVMKRYKLSDYNNNETTIWKIVRLKEE